MTKQELKKARAALKLTQAKLADELGVNKKTLEAWEYGVNPVPAPIKKLLKIMEAK